MIIKKFVRIANVGRFSKLSPDGDVELKEITLIYAENGYGKTTIAGLIRSLKTGEAAYLSERATLGATGKQGVDLLLGSGSVAKFRDGAWSETNGNIEIFDATFVRENVFAGDAVDSEHRRNLYEVVVGAAGVALRNKIDDIDSEGRGVARDIRAAEQAIDDYMQGPFTRDRFLELQQDPDVANKISAATTKLNASRNSKKIVGRKGLDALSVPQSPRGVLDLLKTEVQQVAVEAFAAVKAHLQNRLGAGAEGWIRQGLSYGGEGDCPFCGQDTSDVELVQGFSAYFSDTYNEKVVQLQQAKNRLEQEFGDRAWAHVQQVALENDATVEAWADLSDLSAAKLSLGRLEKSWRHLVAVVGEKLKEKLANPTQSSGDLTDVEAALRDYEDAATDVRKANDKVQVANDTISQLKRDAASTDDTAVEQELRRLRNIEIRHDPKVQGLCDELVALRAKKVRLAADKDEAKNELEAQSGSVLQQYEATINGFLERFGASFRMTGTKPSFPGGKASSTYQIAIRDVAVDLGDSRTKQGTCFRTALSSGDRSTLALAFFLARLDRDTDLDKKLVVFDDPLSSLDCFRSSCTQQEIRRTASKAAQVIVLSHDAFFLKSMYDDERGAKTLHIVGRADSHHMKAWDIEEHCASQAYRDYFLLKSFLAEGVPTKSDLTGVASRVSPYVEDYVRHKYPGDFQGLMTLGDCIRKIKDAPGSDGPGAFKSRVQDLEDINEFGRRFMHGGGSVPAPPSESELTTYVKRAIDLVQGA